MRILLIGILYVAFMLTGGEAYCLIGMPYAARAALYPFVHANIFHLVVNCLSIWALFHPKRMGCRELAIAYLISFLAYPLGFRPCVGFSNVLFAAAGMAAPPLLSIHFWRCRGWVVFMVVSLAMLIFPQFAGTNHLAAFLLGSIVERMSEWFNKLSADVRKASGHR